jgi:cell division protein FtsB
MKKLLRLFANKFVLTIVAFLAWMTYFDQNDWISQKERRQNLDDVRNNISYLNAEIAKMEHQKEGMTSDPGVLEQYAREQYRMKRDNEDLYIIEQ